MQTAVDYKIKYEETLAEVAILKHQLKELHRLIFGSKQERFVPAGDHPSQLTLDIQTEEVAQCNITTAKKIEYTRTSISVTESKQDHPGRTRLPDHLHRREIFIAPQQNTEGCKKIGEEVTEELEYDQLGRPTVERFLKDVKDSFDEHGDSL